MQLIRSGRCVHPTRPSRICDAFADACRRCTPHHHTLSISIDTPRTRLRNPTRVIERIVNAHAECIRQHFAFIFSADGRKLMAWGASRLRHEGYSHAEENSIIELFAKYTDPRILRNLTIVVVRKHNRKYRESRPCMLCCAAIRCTGAFKWCSYSCADGSFCTERTRDMQSSYVSQGRRAEAGPIGAGATSGRRVTSQRAPDLRPGHDV